MFQSELIVGPEGAGKSTAIIQEFGDRDIIHIECLFLNQGYTLNDLLKEKLNIDSSATPMETSKAFKEALNAEKPIVLDNVERIGLRSSNDEDIFKRLLQLMSFSDKGVCKIILDMDPGAISHNSTFLLLASYGMAVHRQNFKPSKETLRKIINKLLPYRATDRFVSELISLSGGQKCTDLQTLLTLHLNNRDQPQAISEETRKDFSDYAIKDQLKHLHEEHVEVIQQASVIGELFSSEPLSDDRGLQNPNAKAVLEQSVCENRFISKCDSEYTFKFLTRETWESIYGLIDTTSKTEWQQKLLKYYIGLLRFLDDGLNRTKALSEISKLATSLNLADYIWLANQQLLHIRLSDGDFFEASEILDRMLTCAYVRKADCIVKRRLQVLNIQLNDQIRRYGRCLELIQQFREDHPSAECFDIDFLQAKALYNTGNTPKAHEILKELERQIKEGRQSSINYENRQYVLVYAMLASVTNHLGYDDKGAHYFQLATNRAEDINDKALINLLYIQSDMFWDFKLTQNKLYGAIDFFEGINDRLKIAEAKFNLATELMLCKSDAKQECYENFESVYDEFNGIPSHNLIYTYNNWAIALILFDENFDAAEQYFKDGLKAADIAKDETDSFTSFTLYLNLAMCQLHQYSSESQAFKETVDRFLVTSKKMTSDEEMSRYSTLYPSFLQILVDERLGNTKKAHEKAARLLSEHSDDFAKPLLEDIVTRTSESSFFIGEKNDGERWYNDNKHYYRKMNELRLFLAEFRYWE